MASSVNGVAQRAADVSRSIFLLMAQLTLLLIGKSLTMRKRLEEFLDALNIRQIDLVANDSATGIAQIFAVNHLDRVRTLLLTDGDAHDNLQPAAFKEFLTMATSGELCKALESMLADKEIFRSDRAMGLAYQRAEIVTDDTIEVYLRPFVSFSQRLRDLRVLGRLVQIYTLSAT